MRKRKPFLLILVLLAGCARQGTIPNTDKFPPHLLSVTSINQTQVVLNFDEKIDSLDVLANTFLISSRSDTAEIRFAATDPNDSRGRSVILLTSPLIDATYRISGLVVDPEGNAASIHLSFSASTRRDTTPASILISPPEPKTSFPYTISFQFSEPVDTGRGMQIITAPGLSDEKLQASWNRDLTRYKMRVSDTTLQGQPFYFALLGGVFDFAGNGTTYGRAAYVHSDTGLVLHDLGGKVITMQGKPAASAIILFKTSDDVFALTIADSAGAFITSVQQRKGTRIQAWFDGDGNGIYEQEASISADPLPDSIILSTSPAASPARLNQLIP